MGARPRPTPSEFFEDSSPLRPSVEPPPIPREVQLGAKPRPAQSEFFEDLPPLRPSAEPPAIRLADLKNDDLRRSRPSRGNLDPLAPLGRLDPLVFARYLIAFSIGMAAALAWYAYSGAAKESAALKAIALDHDALRQSIDRVAIAQEQMISRIERSIERGIERLAAGQDQTTRDINDLQTVEQYLLDKISTPPPRPAPSAVSKPVVRSPQASIQPAPATSP